MGMTAEARETRNEYQRKYRARNRDRINARKRKWCEENPDKIRRYQQCYWERKAGEVNIRLPWSAYGITKERYAELTEIAKSGEYADMALTAALKADEKVAEYILISIREDVSFDKMAIKWELCEVERPPCSRTNFYRARRLFFHYLDVALKELQGKEESEISKGKERCEK